MEFAINSIEISAVLIEFSNLFIRFHIKYEKQIAAKM